MRWALIDTLAIQKAWYAGDGSTTGTLKELLKWRNLLCNMGPKFGYFPNSGRRWEEQLLLKANKPQKETCNLKLLLG